jgi:hypothetical protein
MRNYDEIIGKLMRSAVAMERYTVQQGEPLFIKGKIRRLIDEISKFDEYMSYGADSEMYKELVKQPDTVTNDVYCTHGGKHDYVVIDTDGTVECTKCGLRNSLTE